MSRSAPSRGRSNGRSGTGRRWFALAAVAVLATGGYFAWRTWFAERALAYEPANSNERIARMVESEMLVFELNGSLKKISAALKDLALPGAEVKGLFAPEIAVRDLEARGHRSEVALAGFGAFERSWHVAGRDRRVATADLELWEPFLADVDFWEWDKFFFRNARFLDRDMTVYQSEVGFRGLARMRSGVWNGVRAEQTLEWHKGGAGADGKPVWTITSWRTKSFVVDEVRDLPFADVLDQAVPDANQLEQARTSLHERHVLDLIRHMQKVKAGEPSPDYRPPHRYFFPAAQDHHPAVAVVDIDQDGLDDLYLCVQWGPNQLFRNRGNGTFEEVAARYGLNVGPHSAAALFADFDNDGDADVVIGRTLSPSLYLANEGGRYVDRTGAWTGGPLPSLVSAVTGADLNGDGLLDLYFSTYASDLMRAAGGVADPVANAAGHFGADSTALFLKQFLPADDSRELERRYRQADWHMYRNASGPPNVVLVNQGNGRFAEDRESPLRQFRHTYQATFADYDDDGDADVYLANDFAPNTLYRNDGDGRFTDATAATGTADIGFGMGATWGDYDRDGRQDLYVTNMYSKAGNRILAQLPDVDPAIKKMARGNSLFKNAGEGAWPKVSGEGSNELHVELAEWGWGSQFVDLDNDGWLDLYAPNGHYTPPKEIQAAIDL